MSYPTVACGHSCRLGVLLVSLLFVGLATTASADPIGPSAEHRQITLSVVELMRRDHLLQHPLDDEISQRCVSTFLKTLDPWKVYFYQSDIDEFHKHDRDLDDMARKGKIDFAYLVFKRFLQRVDQRVVAVQAILNGPLDFDKDEQMVSDRDETHYPKTEAEAHDRWRKRIKYELLMLKMDETEGQEALDKLSKRYTSFQKRMHQTDDEELLEMYLTSMTTSYDPHTTYMSPATLENFRIIMRLELEGIGASLQLVDGYTVVKKIIPGGAADKQAGLKVEDKIVGVGQGGDGEIVDTVDMKLSDVVAMIRGKKGTVVRLQLVSVDSPDRKIINITRAKIELKDSEAQAEVFTETDSAGREYQIGVIDLPSFYMDMEGARRGDPNYKSTTRDVRKILDDFNQKGVDAVILDLRRNGGGSLTEAINLTGLFIKEGPVVQVKDGNDRVLPYRDPDPGIAWSGPLVVLTSKLSASASEILAGAIQDYDRGLIVGDKTTHGKGTVQSLVDLGQQLFRIPNAQPMGALKITMQQFYRPSGKSTQNRGVSADLELPSLTTHLDVGEADLDYPIKFDTVKQREFKHFGHVSQAIVERLNQLSVERRKDSEDFQKVLRNIARYTEQKERKYLSLNEAKFMKEREELNADKEEKEALEELHDPDKPAIERNYYLNEALAITLDYLKLKPEVAGVR